MADVHEVLSYASEETIKEWIGIGEEELNNMYGDEYKNVFSRVFDNYDNRRKLMGLPAEVRIPDEFGADVEAISDWLTDEYGYCHKGFALK